MFFQSDLANRNLLLEWGMVLNRAITIFSFPFFVSIFRSKEFLNRTRRRGKVSRYHGFLLVPKQSCWLYMLKDMHSYSNSLLTITHAV